jgi:xeroderma pigmentosum group C-complementing protein
LHGLRLENSKVTSRAAEQGSNDNLQHNQEGEKGRQKALTGSEILIERITFGLVAFHASIARMGPKKSNARAKGKGKATESAVPEIYQQMLAEALPSRSDISERPLKKRRTGPRESPLKGRLLRPVEQEEEFDEDIQFEDVLDVNPIRSSEKGESSHAPKPQQTAYKDSEDESEADDYDWEPIDFDVKPDIDEPSGDLELTLTKTSAQHSKVPVPRRRAVTKDERVMRLETHKMHLLCLISYLDRANDWCNDAELQRTLKVLLDKKTVKFLRPSGDLTQFGQSNSLKRGIELVNQVWMSKYKITARGMRRALWAEDEKDLQNVSDH